MNGKCILWRIVKRTTHFTAVKWAAVISCHKRFLITPSFMLLLKYKQTNKYIAGICVDGKEDQSKMHKMSMCSFHFALCFHVLERHSLHAAMPPSLRLPRPLPLHSLSIRSSEIKTCLTSKLKSNFGCLCNFDPHVLSSSLINVLFFFF